MWLLTDRRLSYGGARAPADDAVKTMALTTKDGIALLGYAGLGATARGSQPSEWMNATLRGRGDLTLEQALSVLANAANRELPRHLRVTPGGGHMITVPAFVTGVGPRLYGIDVAVTASGQRYYNYTTYQRTKERGSPSPRLALSGTGGIYLAARSASWQRGLLNMVNAHDKGRVSDIFVADRLAGLNYEAFHGVGDGTVGPRCIVAWRRRPEFLRTMTGGGHQCYAGLKRDPNSPAFPTIQNGIDIRLLVKAVLPVVMPYLERSLANPEVANRDDQIDEEEIGRRIALEGWDPDDKLR